MNTLTDGAIRELARVIDMIASSEKIKGVIVCSGKAGNFCAGADLGDLAEYAGTRINDIPLAALYRKLETVGKPIAIAIEGLALGGGLEFALACHYRVAADAKSVKLGLPEVNVGLLPGGGGTQRLPRLVGMAEALPMLLKGRPVDARKAQEIGLIDELAPAGETIEAARKWLKENGNPVARWDERGFKAPGGLPFSPKGMQLFVAGNAMLRKETYGNYPAAENILKCVFEGFPLAIDKGLKVEERYFINSCATPQARDMVRSLFLSKQALSRGGDWAKKADPPKRAAIIGAGMMGAGIAYAQAARKMDTVLIDVDESTAEKGKDYSRGLVEKAVKKGRMSQEDGAALLDRISTTSSYDALDGADIVVEAVFENIDLKHNVIRQIEQRLPEDTLLGSNTSTLPITGLAEASSRPENFIGIHFFSPVDRMELVEIIRGEKTSDEAVARAVAYSVAIGKTPIVVNDSRGFYTSRCFGTYIYEGAEMLVEGLPAPLIENVGRMTGMPRGPLEIADDVALDLIVRIFDQTKTALGADYDERPYEAVMAELVKRGRTGRKADAGFYDYPDDGPKRLWAGLTSLLPATATEPVRVVGEIKKRLLHRQALEAARCFDEGVINDPRAADVGAILGWGFAPWTGGPLSYIDACGPAQFVADCDAFVEEYGVRFAPPEGLREMAETGRTYYKKPSRNAA